MRLGFIYILLAISVNALSQKYELTKAVFNSPYNDFCAIKCEDGSVFFGTNRKTDGLFVRKDSEGNPPQNIFVAKPDNFKNPVSVGAEITTINNEGPFFINHQGDAIYYTATIDGNLRRADYLGIFHSRKQNNSWTEPKPFPFNSVDGSYNVLHPSLSTDGSQLFFVSDMPGGAGQGDLYVCNWDGKQWTTPANLGNAVNSVGNEVFPFFHGSGKLYFSSDKADDGNKLDIYSIDLSNASDTCLKLPEPFNTKADDFGYWSEDSDETGFISSNRDGANDQIFEFKFIYPEFVECVQSEPMDLCYHISEEEIVPVDTLPFKFEWDYGDGTKGEGLSNLHCFPGEGSYDIHMTIFDTLTSSVFARVSESNLIIEKPYAVYIAVASDESDSSLITLEARTEYLDNFTVEKIYWNWDNDNYRQGRTLEIEALEDTIEVSVLVTGKLSNGEQARFCAFDMLWPESEKEAPEAEDTIIENVDPMNTMSVAIASLDAREHPEREVSTEEKTYFVEFHVSDEPLPTNDPFFKEIHYPITEREDENHDYHYSVGDTENPYKLYPLIKELRNAGFEKSIVRESIREVFAAKVTGESFMSEKSESEINRRLEKFSDVNFDYNKWTILPESYENLDYIVRAMILRPDFALHITAHTDNQGDEDYNHYLSVKRAQSVVEYLRKEGVDVSRISSDGRGEANPITSNEDEAGRRKNRRVEFEITLQPR
jgi:outer membrane protein OmpA-like peptidoglycan-associated protein